jgi:hydrogenase expression/formation protein HypC
MCLAVPMKILEVSMDRREATVDLGGSPKLIGLQLVPEARRGDFVLVHAGMAITVIEEEEALETLRVFKEYAIVPGLFALTPDQENGPQSI